MPAALMMAIVVLSGCVKESPGSTVNQTPVATGILKGVSFLPVNYTAEGMSDFFNKAKLVGSIVSWAGDWNELSNTQSGTPAVVSALADNYKLTPVIEVQFFTQSTGKLLRPLDNVTRQNYLNYLTSFAETYKPKYLGIGIEVNILYEKSAGDFDSFVSFYGEAYDAVKAKSPATKVFTIFQLEKMKGLGGGLFGGTNNPADAEWPLMDRFKSDIIAFTSYPDLIYKSPSEMPGDYYTDIRAHTTKPIAFTETGWHSASSPAGWESSESEQAQFVTAFFNMTKSLGSEFVIWPFVYNPKTVEPFSSMGLFNSDGTAKLAWSEWTGA